MASNYPPGAETDPRAPWNWAEEDDEFEHDPYCAVNRASGGRCDCQEDW